MRKDFYKLMLVTNKGTKPLKQYLDFVALCAKSGITSVQMREKFATYGENIEFGKALKKLLEEFEIPIIVNDSLDLALELDADGLHLGQKDGEVEVARKFFNGGKIIGLSVSSIFEIQQANLLLVDYVGCGPVFPTNNKLGAKSLGIDNFKKISILSKHKVIAIGGINEHNVKGVMSLGADGIAAIDAFHTSSDIVRTTANLCRLINEYSKE